MSPHSYDERLWDEEVTRRVTATISVICWSRYPLPANWEVWSPVISCHHHLPRKIWPMTVQSYHVTITSLARYDQWQSGKLAKSGPFKTISWDAGLLELSGVKSSQQCLMDAWYGICLCPLCTLAPWYERKANYQISPRCLIPTLIALIIALPPPPPSSPYQHIHTSQHAQH